MVYCDFVSANNNEIVYLIGGRTDDITGKLVIHMDDESYELVSPPEKSKVYDPLIASMLRRNIDNFKKGIYKKKMSYEI